MSNSGIYHMDDYDIDGVMKKYAKWVITVINVIGSGIGIIFINLVDIVLGGFFLGEMLANMVPFNFLGFFITGRMMGWMFSVILFAMQLKGWDYILKDGKIKGWEWLGVLVLVAIMFMDTFLDTNTVPLMLQNSDFSERLTTNIFGSEFDLWLWSQRTLYLLVAIITGLNEPFNAMSVSSSRRENKKNYRPKPGKNGKKKGDKNNSNVSRKNNRQPRNANSAPVNAKQRELEMAYAMYRESVNEPAPFNVFARAKQEAERKLATSEPKLNNSSDQNNLFNAMDNQPINFGG